jgi:hypothetical protein
MKKSIRLTVFLGCFLIVGLVWVNSVLALQDDNCRCINHSDQWQRCQALCIFGANSTCAMVISEPTGGCIDQTCWVFFTYWCENGVRGSSLSSFQYCPDCYN